MLRSEVNLALAWDERLYAVPASQADFFGVVDFQFPSIAKTGSENFLVVMIQMLPPIVLCVENSPYIL